MRETSFTRRHIRPLVPLLLVLPLIAGCSRTRSVEYPMLWEAGTEPDHVYLTFMEFPNHYVDLNSLELRAYLDSLGTGEVNVLFEVRTKLGCVESIRETRIGDRTDWPHLWGGSGWVQHEHPSPWDEFKCRIPWW